jgi:hypothetical protein
MGELLRDQLQTARAAHLAASARFDSLVKAAPSGLPSPDGSPRIHKAGRERSAALQHYMQALKVFSEYALRHTLPDHFLSAK